MAEDQAQHLFDKVVRVFGGVEPAEKWFAEKNYSLGNSSPQELSATEAGIRDVEDLLGRIQRGVFS